MDQSTRSGVEIHGPPANGRMIITALGTAQILAWGSSYYLLTVLAKPIAADTGWSQTYVVGGISLALVVSGLVSPKVGRLISGWGGRPVLAGGALVLAAGQTMIGLAPTLAVFLAGWAVIGAAMGACLYDPAFSTLGRLYGAAARPRISLLTLFGGLASTICWPISAWLLETVGWRGTCLVYAGLQAAVCVPLIWFSLPREAPRPTRLAGSRGGSYVGPLVGVHRTMFFLLAACLVIGGLLVSIISIHLFVMLQGRGLSLVEAVSLGMMIGPAQVAGRSLELAFGRKVHPIWTLLAACGLVATGVLFLFAGLPLPGFGFAFYGLGIGILTIAHGAVPLVLFGEHDYPVLMGKLSLPVLVAQAAGPSLGDFVMRLGGAKATFLSVAVLAVANVLLAGLLVSLWRCSRNAIR